MYRLNFILRCKNANNKKRITQAIVEQQEDKTLQVIMNNSAPSINQRMMMREVVAFIDVHGYQVNHELIPKELSIKGTGNAKPFTTHYFNLATPIEELDTQDRMVADFVQQNVFDIAYNDYWFGMLNPDATGDLVECIKPTPPTTISEQIPIAVAYRNSDYLASLLNLAGIPALNLKDAHE